LIDRAVMPSGPGEAGAAGPISWAELSSRAANAKLKHVILKVGYDRCWDSEISPDLAVDIVERIGEFVHGGSQLSTSSFGPSCSLILWGGDPFGDPEVLARLAGTSKRQGFYTQVQTWGRWATSPEILDRGLDAVRGLVDLMSLTVSARDARLNGIDHVPALLNAARSRRISSTMNLILDDGDNWPVDLLALPCLNEDACVINVMPVIGSATPEGLESDFTLGAPPRFECQRQFGLVIDPHGDAYSCSPMMGTKEFRVGNVFTDGVADLVARLVARPDLVRLACCGPSFLVEEAKARGLDHLLPTQMVDACDFHRKLMAVPELREMSARLASQE
jgi:MoaA/NifB/PqqE/SkfB family radical SAM enzyme